VTKGVGPVTAREPEASSVPKPSLLVRLVRVLLLVAAVFAGVQFVLELVAWVNRARAVSGKTDAEVRATIIGDIAPFLENAAKQIPERDRVLLVTNESPWRARYLLLPRPVYVYRGPLPRPEDVTGKFLKEQGANVYLFRGSSFDFAGEEATFSNELGTTIDGKYESLKLRVRKEIGEAKRMKKGGSGPFIKRFAKLKEKYLVLCAMDNREVMSDARMLADAELKELEKRLDEATV
jgi:hypothetical protein